MLIIQKTGNIRQQVKSDCSICMNCKQINSCSFSCLTRSDPSTVPVEGKVGDDRPGRNMINLF